MVGNIDLFKRQVGSNQGRDVDCFTWPVLVLCQVLSPVGVVLPIGYVGSRFFWVRLGFLALDRDFFKLGQILDKKS
jgi:hypothetical protein